MSQSLHLIVVDPQNDFTDPNGALYVTGADQDMVNLANMVDRLADRIDDIHVTMDSHHTVGIERPEWWRRASDGAKPAPFTCLGIHPDRKRIVKYVVGGTKPNAFGMSATEEEYTTRIPSYLYQGGTTGKGSFGYLEALETRGRYPHIVWTEHCIVGGWGWSVNPTLHAALCKWERGERGLPGSVNYITKGSNRWTEHFSGLAAEVPDPADPHTLLNMDLIRILETADVIALTGEALSHCVANTGRDIAAAFSDPRYVEKLVLIRDCTSNVSGFDFLGTAFVNDMVAKGMRIATSTDFLA